MIQNYFHNVKTFLGSSGITARARVRWGKRSLLFSISKNSPALSAPSARSGWEAARPCVSKEAKPAKIVSLIEKIFCARPLKEKEIFAGFAYRRQAVASRWAGLSPVGRQSEISVGILFKIGSNFIQKVPPIYDFRVFESSCLAFASLGLGKSHDFIGIFEIKKQFSFQNLEVRFAEGEHKLKNLLTNLFCSAFGGMQNGNLSRKEGLTAKKRL